MRSIGCAIVVLLALTGANTSLAAAEQQFGIVSRGRAVAHFDVSSVTNETDLAAVRKDIALFNKYLGEVTGVTLPERAPDGGNVIRIVLKSIRTLESRFNWRIRFQSSREMIVEATTTSLFTALRQLIEEGCDARFLGVEKCMFQYEPRQDVVLPVRTRESAPKSYTLLRNVYWLPQRARELGLSDDELFSYTHGIPIYAFPSGRYGVEGWPSAAMPTLKGSKLTSPPSSNVFVGWQPCYSSPEAAEIAVQNVMEYLNAHPDTLSLTLGVNDQGGYCECERCRVADAKGERSIFANDPSNHSFSYYSFVNRVAEAVGTRYPTVKIGLLAYMGTIMPPPFPLRRNIVPMMTLDTLSAGMNSEVLKAQDDVIRRWGEKVEATGIWDYCWGRTDYMPRINFPICAARLKYLYEQGGRAYFGENSYMVDMLDGPKTYLTARLLENVEADPDMILDEWFVRFSGAAASKALRDLYDACGKYWQSKTFRESAIYPSTRWIYMIPAQTHLYAVDPGFTSQLVSYAREVCRKASTPGEKKRAETLLCHFELLDCVASYRGVAFVMPSSGELERSADADKMLNDLLDRKKALAAEWKHATDYFNNADFDDGQVYVKNKIVEFDRGKLLMEPLVKAVGFVSAPTVKKALQKIAENYDLPESTRRMISGMTNDGFANAFSNPGFAKPLSDMRITSGHPFKIVPCGKGKALFVMPGMMKSVENGNDAVLAGIATFSLTENLKPGTWAVSVEVKTPSAGTAFDLDVWRQKGGENEDWDGMAWTPLEAGESRTFVRIVDIGEDMDGVNLHLRMQGFGKDDPILVQDIKIVRIADYQEVK